ncbi:MAG: hypothetical protein F6K09_25555, partial [Merismopedia sp. SIO2A8]|nr:hypothetical protein [Merismopedia sp. SIO2A8]
MTISPNATSSDVKPSSDSAVTLESSLESDLDANNGWLLPLSAIALLGAGLLVAKPLLESILQTPKLQAPIQTSAGRQDVRIVELPSSLGSAQVAPSTTVAPFSTTNSATALSQDGVTFDNPTVPAATDTTSPSDSRSTSAEPQVRLIPPDAPQPGVVAVAPTPLASPTASLPSASPAPTAAPPNTSALRRAVRNLAQAIPRPSAPLQSIAQSPSLPQEDEFIASLYPPGGVNPDATGDVIVRQPLPQELPQGFPQPDINSGPSLQPLPALPPITVPEAPPEALLPQTPRIQAPPLPPQSPITTRPPEAIPVPITPPQAVSPSLDPELEQLVPDLDPGLDDAISVAPLPQRPSLPNEVALNQINVTGSTVFSSEELAADARQAVRASLGETGEVDNASEERDRPFDGSETVSIAQLIQASDRITQRYVDAGYISSGAIIPEDGIQPDGTVNIQVIEGELEEINVVRSPGRQESLLNHSLWPLGRFASVSALSEWLFPEVHRNRLFITGNRPLGLGYVRRRLARAGSSPLNLNRLLRGVQLLQVDPLIDTVSTEIREGTGTGTSILDVNVVEAPTTSAQVSVDNARSPSVGSVQQRASLSQGNFLGWGDRLILGANQTEGSDGWNISYAIPINRRNGWHW